MTLSPAFLDELRSRTLLSALIGRSTKLQKAGREWKACCPFHNEKSPSFYVNDDKAFYHCFGCSAHGDAIRWLTDAKGLPFMDAVKELAASARMEMPAPDPRSAERAERDSGLHAAMAAAQLWFAEQLQGIAGAEARAYLAKRGIEASAIEAFGIGFAPDSRGKLKTALARFGDAALIECGLLISVEDKDPYDRFRGRVMIPIRDPRGRTIAFGGRILGAGEPKYLNSPDTPLFDKGRTLYNLDRAAGPARKVGRLIVVEGYMDAIALAGAGIEEVVAPLGTALTEAQLERLWRLVDVPLLCFDGDSAGQKAAMRAALRALPMLEPSKWLSFARLPNGIDPDDFVQRFGSAALRKLLATPTDLPDELFRAEVAATDATSPNERAKLKQRLLDLSASISNQIVAKEYARTFSDKWWATFGWGKWKKAEIVGVRSALAHTRGRTRQTGLDTLIRAVLLGLSRYPLILKTEAESVERLHIENRYLADWRDILLEAMRERPDLDEDLIDAILQESDVSPVEKRDLQKDLAFSFFRRSDERARAMCDLKDVIEAINADHEIELQLEAVLSRYKANLNDEEHDEQVRLRAAKLANLERMSELAASIGEAKLRLTG